MLPKLAGVQSGVSGRGRCGLLLCAMALLVVPTWSLQAQFSGAPGNKVENKPDVKSDDKPGEKPASPKTAAKADPAKPAASIPPAAVRRPALPPMAPPSIEFLPEPTPVEKEILQKLNEQVDFDFSSESLSGVCDFLNQLHGLQCVIDKQALEENSIAIDATDITLKVSGISLRSALNLVLKPNGLAFIIDDEVVKITSLEKASTTLMTRTYPVRDLVGNVDVEYDLLARAIQDAVGGPLGSPWVESEGEGGTVSALPATGTLVIRQTARAHDEILQLLRAIRKANQEMQPKTSQVVPHGKTPVAGVEVGCKLLNLRVSDARVYPLVGPARLATAHVQCNVKKGESTDVFYLDESRLIPVN